jgi:4-hydroxy-tetrahydrodipicolinate synthase
LPLLAVGAVGVVGTSTHWTAPHFQKMIAAFQAGDVAAARAINARLLDSFGFINGESSVFSMSIKAMLRTLGQEVGDCRLPLPPAPPEVAQHASAVWSRLSNATA